MTFYKVFILLFLVAFFGCSKPHEDAIVLGNQSSSKVWIYLCGLTQSFDGQQECNNRNILDRMGQEIGVKFVAVKPKNRCHQFDNKLCWPHDSESEVNKTYSEIVDALNGQQIAGFIGFSNGGFFLNQLVQTKELGVPVVSVGSAGVLKHDSYANNLYLLVGKNDIYHYQHAKDFYNASQSFSRLRVELIEYDGGHEIPDAVLSELLKKLRG
ncbi:MAG: hypothetical protein H6679_03375 [Epsilonproteobacteria bacterium]|nr:hypothetical protein [Campylobacterota bacterium]